MSFACTESLFIIRSKRIRLPNYLLSEKLPIVFGRIGSAAHCKCQLPTSGRGTATGKRKNPNPTGQLQSYSHHCLCYLSLLLFFFLCCAFAGRADQTELLLLLILCWPRIKHIYLHLPLRLATCSMQRELAGKGRLPDRQAGRLAGKFWAWQG